MRIGDFFLAFFLSLGACPYLVLAGTDGIPANYEADPVPAAEDRELTGNHYDWRLIKTLDKDSHSYVYWYGKDYWVKGYHSVDKHDDCFYWTLYDGKLINKGYGDHYAIAYDSSEDGWLFFTDYDHGEDWDYDYGGGQTIPTHPRPNTPQTIMSNDLSSHHETAF